jgi:copper chaperone CopZ
MLIKKYIKISGTHCQSCKTLIETELDLLKGVNKVEVDHVSGECFLEFEEDLIF